MLKLEEGAERLALVVENGQSIEDVVYEQHRTEKWEYQGVGIRSASDLLILSPPILPKCDY